jgi:hypothetical protein
MKTCCHSKGYKRDTQACTAEVTVSTCVKAGKSWLNEFVERLLLETITYQVHARTAQLNMKIRTSSAKKMQLLSHNSKDIIVNSPFDPMRCRSGSNETWELSVVSWTGITNCTRITELVISRNVSGSTCRSRCIGRSGDRGIVIA